MDAPSWSRAIDRALAQAMREAPMLASATPVAGASRAEIVAAFERGEARDPGWRYAPIDAGRAEAMAKGLDAIARDVEARAPDAIALAYADRARELACEVRVAAAVGTATIGARARERFAPDDEARDASELAAAWIAEPRASHVARDRSSDEGDGSLAARLREEIGRRRLPFRVAVSPTLAPLAATGDGMIWVAAGRRLTREDVERTTVHEIEAHAMPRTRAASLSLGLFALGTARGVDEQEGLALLLEERHGFLRGMRRRELALRHRAVEAMDAGASFVDAVRVLVERDGATWARAVAAAERAFRGSDGRRPGLGRERVYLAAYVRVARHLRARPADERVLTSGQVAVAAIDAVAPFA